MTDLDATELKLAAARTRLILDKPFLGALVLRLPMAAAKADWCPTTATDARKFYYCAEYKNELSVEQTQFMLAHEALHCALSHFARRQHRINHRWDLACDFAINPLLLEEGLKPPPNAQIMDQYKGMTAEEIYPLIEDKEDMDTLDQHVYDKENQAGGGQQGDQKESEFNKKTQQDDPEDQNKGDQPSASADISEQGQDAGDGEHQPPPLSNAEQETLAIQWQQRMAGAAQQAILAGKRGGSLARMIDHLLQPQLPWRMLLARYMTTVTRNDFSYMRPSRREGDAILPSLRSSQIELVVALDTSGSIKSEEIAGFMAEINALKGQMRAKITLIPCDAAIPEAAPWFYEPWEEFIVPDSLTGGGGTDFRPVFDWVDSEHLQPALLVYFTDAQGKFPELEPNFPVLWLVKGKSPVPWGQRIQLN